MSVPPVAPPAVVFVVSHLKPTLGLERAVLEVAGLLQAQVPVRIVSLGESGPVDLPEGLDGTDGPAVQLTVLGDKHTGWRRSGELLRIRRFARSADPEAVYICAGVWASIPWLLAAPALARRTLVWEHSLAREQIASSRLLRVRARLAALLYPRARQVVCVGEPLARDVAAMHRKIVTTVIENPVPTVDPVTFAARLEREGREAGRDGHRLLAVGSLTRNKNQQLAVRALATLPARYTLCLAGDGPQRPRLEQLVDALGVRDRVTLLGRLDPAAMDALYRDCDVLIHPALGETFGYVYFEAADWGIPVVAVAHRVAAQFIPDLVPGTLVDPQVPAIAAAAANAGGAPREQLLRARSARAARFDAASITERWLGAIDLVVGEPAVRIAGSADRQRRTA